MKKVIVKGINQWSVVDVEQPRAIDGWSVVKIHSAPMCTEYKFYRDGTPKEFLGHEAAGEIVEVGKNSTHKVGDRVVVMPQYPCRQCALCLSGEYIHCENVVSIEDATGSSEGTATYAEFLIKPDWLLYNIPDEMTYDQAGMLCCGLGPTYGAMNRTGVGAFDSVLITGMGPVGLGGIINGVFRNARVIVTANTPYRVELARELGAFAVINYGSKTAIEEIRELTDGRGADHALECSGSTEAQRFCIDAVRRHGQVAFIGEGGELPIHISKDMIRKGISLHGIWHYNLNDIPQLFQIVERRSDLIAKLITHTFPMSQVAEAWELQLTRQCGKVILHPAE